MTPLALTVYEEDFALEGQDSCLMKPNMQQLSGDFKHHKMMEETEEISSTEDPLVSF